MHKHFISIHVGEESRKRRACMIGPCQAETEGEVKDDRLVSYLHFHSYFTAIIRMGK